MTEKDDSAIPAWQRDQPDAASDTPQSHDDTGVASQQSDAPANHASSDDLEVARRFLDDEEVKSAPREKKVEFLQAKGIKDEDIAKLLGESPTSTLSTAEHESEPSSSVSPRATALPTTADRPPIVTYPEFLTKPTRQPPLVTTAALLTTASTLAGFAALVHGTSRYLLTPMLESQTSARLDFHATTASRLDSIVSRLESTVSTVPPKKPSATTDVDSEADDPTELFHRDVGTQTANLDERTSPLAAPKPLSPSSLQTDTLNSLTRTLSSIKDGIRTQSENLEDVKTLVDVFRDDLDAMVYGGNGSGPYDFSSGGGAVSFGFGSSAKKNEPDDEIKKVKDSVRRVKGALLSTRSFPASTA